MPVSEDGGSFEKSLLNLGGNITDPFIIFDDVKELYIQVLKTKREKAEEWKKNKNEWEKKYPEMDKKLHYFYSGILPEIDYKAVKQKEGSATRAASALML